MMPCSPLSQSAPVVKAEQKVKKQKRKTGASSQHEERKVGGAGEHTDDDSETEVCARAAARGTREERDSRAVYWHARDLVPSPLGGLPDPMHDAASNFDRIAAAQAGQQRGATDAQPPGGAGLAPPPAPGTGNSGAEPSADHAELLRRIAAAEQRAAKAGEEKAKAEEEKAKAEEEKAELQQEVEREKQERRRLEHEHSTGVPPHVHLASNSAPAHQPSSDLGSSASIQTVQEAVERANEQNEAKMALQKVQHDQKLAQQQKELDKKLADAKAEFERKLAEKEEEHKRKLADVTSRYAVTASPATGGQGSKHRSMVDVSPVQAVRVNAAADQSAAVTTDEAPRQDTTAAQGQHKKDMNRVTWQEIRDEAQQSEQMAKKIVEHRDTNPFRSWKDVSDIPGIGIKGKKLEKLQAVFCIRSMSSGATVTQLVSPLL